MSNLSHTNKKTLANTIALLAVVAVISYAPFSLAEVNNDAKLYTQEGYPYGPLIERIASVKIRYSQQADNQVQCSTEIAGNGQSWKTEMRRVSKKKFDKRPLKSCLDRVLAKQILATTY